MAGHGPAGEELRAWARATHQRLAIKRHNRETALALVALAGMTTAAVSNNGAVKAVGGLAAAGSLAAIGVDEANQGVQQLEQPAVPLTPPYYESHLLNAPFSVPPGLFSKRWITLSTAGDGAPCVRSLVIDYDLEDGQREHVYLTFRHGMNRSEWQDRECLHGPAGRQYSNGVYAND